MIRVALADDHRIVREGLRRLLAAAADVNVVGEVGSGDELLAFLSREPADVLVLDVSMPRTSFTSLLGALREAHPRLRIVVLSAHAETEYAVRALREGAAGYLTKERSSEELVEAVRRVARGARYVTPSVAELLAEDVAGEREDDAGVLSDRELEVLRLIGAGRSVKEIAAQLRLSPKTVSTYRTRMLEKLSLKTTADLIRFALARGLAAPL